MNLPRGRRIISEKISEIGTIYDRIPEDFEGSVRIFMKFEGGLHRGDLLIGGSNILCVSLDDLDKGGSIYGEEAFGEIKKRISGAVGDVDVYIFNDTEMSLAIRTNEMILLKPVLSLSRFSELASVPAEKGAVRAAEKGAVRAAEKGAVRAAEKGAEEEWVKELGKLDEEWDKLKDEWNKLESIKGLSIESKEKEAYQASEPVEELSSEELAILKTKPSLVKNIGFADKLRFLRFPNSSNALGLMDGKRTLEGIADEIKIDKRSIINLIKDLTKRGYIKEGASDENNQKQKT